MDSLLEKEEDAEGPNLDPRSKHIKSDTLENEIKSQEFHDTATNKTKSFHLIDMDKEESQPSIFNQQLQNIEPIMLKSNPDASQSLKLAVSFKHSP